MSSQWGKGIKVKCEKERRWGKQDWHELKTLCAHHLDSHYSLEKWVLFSHVRNWRNRGMAVKYWPLVELPIQIIINYNGSIRVSGIREPAQTSSWELMACIISQLCLQWHHIGSLILAMEGVFTPRRSTNITDSFPPWSQLLSIYQHTTGYSPNVGWNINEI